MVQTLLTILGISVIVAIPSSMLVLSLKAGRPYIKDVLNNPSMLIRYFLVMFILIPALALTLLLLDTDHISTWLAVLVISLSPASPGMLKNVNKLAGDSNISIAWMIIAIFISMVMLPFNLLVIGRILNINIDLGIDDVVLKLLILFILPMMIGFLISKFLSESVSLITKIFEKISIIASIVMLICVLILATPVLISKSIISLILIFGFLLFTLIISLIFEIPGQKYGPVLAYSVILRLPAPAIVLASINNKTMIYLPEILSFVIIGIILMMIYKKLFQKKIITG